MEEVTLTLDRTQPDFKVLERELTTYLQSLENVSYEQVKVSPAPGTLEPIDAETVRITIELATSVIELITAIALIVAQVRAASLDGSTRGGRSRSLQLRVRDLELSLPASEATVRKFIASLAKPPAKTQPDRRARKRSEVRKTSGKRKAMKK